MVVTLGQQYNIGEKPTVILYSYINRHAGTPDKQRRQNSTSYQTTKTNPIQSLKREQRTMMMRIFIIQVHDPVIHLEIDEELWRSHRKVRGKRKELGSSLHTCQGYDTQMLLMHGLSYGPAMTRNTKERAYVCQSDQVGLRPSRVTTHPYDPDPNCLQLRVFYSKLSCRNITSSSCRAYTSSFLRIVPRIFLQSGTV